LSFDLSQTQVNYWIHRLLPVLQRSLSEMGMMPERGEDIAKKAYKDALAENLPANVMTVVQAQSNEVMTAHDKVRDLRDAANNTTSTTATT
jgi:hypothetical protein